MVKKFYMEIWSVSFGATRGNPRSDSMSFVELWMKEDFYRFSYFETADEVIGISWPGVLAYIITQCVRQ